MQTGRDAHRLAAGDFNGDGLTDVAAIGARSVTVHYQQPGFAPWKVSTLDPGAPIAAAASGFCNRDRLADIALLCDDPPRILVYCAARGERFSLSWKSALPVRFDGILLADIDNDGKSDILLFGRRHLGVSVFKGRGDGSFSAAVPILPEYSVAALDVADLNGDGVADIIAGTWVSDQLAVFTGFGKMHFSEPSILQFKTEPRSFATVRLDSDAVRDLVVSFPEEHLCRLFLGDGLGGFHPLQDVATAAPVTELGAADLNGDGKEDLALLSAEGGGLTLELNGGGGVGDPVTYRAGTMPTALALIAHGRTRLTDAVILDSATSRLRVFYSSLIDTVTLPEKSYALGLRPEGLLAADFNHDGWDDVAVADSRSRCLSLFLNDGRGSLRGQVSFGTANGLTSLEYVRRTDSTALFLGSNAGTTATTVIEIDTRTFSHSVVELPSQGEQTLLSARVDSSNRYLHLMVLERDHAGSGGEIIEYEQVGPARYIERSVAAHLPGPIVAAALRDSNGGSNPGAISLVYDSRVHRHFVYVWSAGTGDTLGSPRLAATMDTSGPAGAFLWGRDLNQDGIPDLIAGFQAPVNRLSVLLGRRDGGFDAAYTLPVPIGLAAPRDLEVADMNGDGIADLVIDNEVTRSIEIYTGEGDGTFDPGLHVISTRGLGGFVLDDIDHDRLPELIITDAESGLLKILSLKGGE